jgi:hypothetical protein
MRIILIVVSLSLVFLTTADPLVAAELSGTAYSDGVPTANLRITVEGRDDETRTDGRGGYRLDLPPGNYILIIQGQRFPVKVLPVGTRYDPRL